MVIWVVRACDTSIPEFGSYEDVDNNIIKFETMLMEVFPQLDLDITVESKFNNIFRTNLKLTGLKRSFSEFKTWTLIISRCYLDTMNTLLI